MGLEKSTQGKTTFYSLKAKTGDGDDTPYFVALGKVHDEWTEVGERSDRISGRLTDIEHKTYGFGDDQKHKVIFKMTDASGGMQVQANFNNLTYSILNSLLSCHPDEIAIEVWLGKEKMIQGKPKRFPSAKVINNGDKLDWAIEAMGMPKAEKVKVGGMTVSDSTRVFEFWIDVIARIKSRIADLPVASKALNGSAAPVTSNRMTPNTQAEPDSAGGRAGTNKLDSESFDDLPF